MHALLHLCFLFALERSLWGATYKALNQLVLILLLLYYYYFFYYFWFLIEQYGTLNGPSHEKLRTTNIWSRLAISYGPSNKRLLYISNFKMFPFLGLFYYFSICLSHAYSFIHQTWLFSLFFSHISSQFCSKFCCVVR